ncbi:MAG: Gfo/Idh/MocA family oxidoreductase [Prevotellaceae bacterium]|jgi:predicted dehydrogenase|nr:Gfo/Idh/MocA family oxidoreductase [Prevotellaceae bacterium]
MNSNNKLNRRQFLSTAAIAGTGAIVAGGTTLSSCASAADPKKPVRVPIERLKTWRIPNLIDKVVDGRELKIGLVGCGGQGTGDLIGAAKCGDNIKVVALGDVLRDRLDSSRDRVKKDAGQEVPESNCFVGLDAYKKVIDLVDVVLLITPPAYRPIHFEYAVKAGKHVFMEKPICVDVAGYNKLVASAKIADTKKLCVCTGTQRRHERRYVEAYKQILDGAIGEITGGAVYWNQSQLWSKKPEKETAEWMIRDWVNWTWLSGDHIVEQHVHNIDVFNWFSGLKPVAGTAFGARHRRPTGDQYDMFSVDYEYENGIHMHSMSRQINGCTDNVSEFVQGSLGSWSSRNEIKDLQGNVIWKYEGDKGTQNNPYVLEFIDLFSAVRQNKPFNETIDTANSSLQAVLGRESAYTGKRIVFDELKASNMDLLSHPALAALQNESVDVRDVKIDFSQFPIPVPGKGN